MNKKNLSVQKAEKKARFTFSTAHVILAVVAIIECLILISFTTYSWIETASSLHIWNGKKSIVQSDTYTKMNIVDTLNFEFKVGTAPVNLNASSEATDLNNFFRSVKFYQFAKTSSPDGRTFYFKRPSPSTGYRQGDTTDYNTSYTYFDFQVNNSGYSGLTKLKFFFKDADVFQISPGTSGLTNDQCKQIEKAMRISFFAGTGSGAATIYSETGESEETLTYDARNNTSGGVTSVTTHKIKADENQKLFTVSKNGTNKISVRIWLESEDSNLSGFTANQLAGLDIDINLKLSYASNDYDFLYFDDYTFSNDQGNNGGHLTDDLSESNSNRMYFVYKASSSGAGAVYPMTHDSSGANSNATSWVTCDSNGRPSAIVPNTTGDKPYIDNLCTSNHNCLKYSYFAYGPCNRNTTTTTGLGTPIYTWNLSNPSNDNFEHRFLGYSVINTKLTSSSATVTTYGAGDWDANLDLAMVYFRDLATGLTESAYNAGNNFKYITDAVNTAADTDDSLTRNNVLYVNNTRGAVATTSATMKTQAMATANMYYDTNADNRNGLFKAWIPDTWLDGEYLTFRFCPNGYYNNCTMSWAAPVATKANNSDEYVYTALGYHENFVMSYYDGAINSGRDSYVAQGTGTWYPVENQPINLSSELIDTLIDQDQRYVIGVKLGTSTLYYHLVPDETNQLFYAYIPDPKNGNSSSNADYSAGDITFTGYSSYGSNSHPTNPSVNAQWLANVRNGSRTYYPVKMDASNPSDYTRGYWHISVIVDGTYEHLFWDIGDEYNAADDGVLGNFYFNTTGHPDTDPVPDANFDLNGYQKITPYTIDEYRWYVPLDSNPNAEFIYYRWDPYSDVTLKFNHNRADGIYCVVTEAPDGSGS